MRHGRRWVAALAAGTLVTGIGAAAMADDSPPLEAVAPYGDGDGLHRWVVTLAADAAGSTTLAEASAAGVARTASVTAATSATPRIDVARLAAAQAAVGTGGATVQDGARVLYVAGAARVDITDDGAAPAPGPDVAAPAPAPAPLPATDPTDPDAVLAALAAHPDVDSAQYVGTGADRVLVATRLGRAAVEALPGVAAVVPTRADATVLAELTDPYWAPYGWNLENTGSNAYAQAATAGADVDATTGWDATQGQGTVIAVVDTGFDSDHPDLAGALWTNPSEACGAGDQNGNGLVGDCHGWNFYANSPDVDNGNGGEHGTSVSGAAAARANNGHGSAGVAPQATIMPLVVGHGREINTLLASKAIRYAADNGATVINGSFGGTGLSPDVVADLSAAIDYAYAKGVLFVAAAGNDHLDRDTSVVYPASMPNAGMVVVGSTDARDALAGHSAYGRNAVDLFAPGELVATTTSGGGYAPVSGTSIAAPHVAAAVALYRSANPTLDAAQIKARLLADTTKLPALAGRSVSGGRLSVARVAAAVGESTSYRFASMVAAPGAQAPTVTVTSTAGAGTYSAVVGLAMLVDGEIWAVVDEDVTLDGQTLVTNDQGQVTFPLGSRTHLGASTLALGTSLGEGSFGLTVQVLRDGVPLTRPYAAPLLVSSTPPAQPAPDAGDVPRAPATPAPGGSTPVPGGTSPAPGGTSPGGSTPAPGGSTPAPGGTTPGGGTGGGDGPSPSDPSPSDPAPSDPAPSAPVPSDPAPGGPREPVPGGTPGGGTAPGGGTDPAPGGSPSPPPVPGGGGSNPAPGSPAPDDKLYDGVGAFRVTRISPVHVTTSGGTLVRVTAEAMEPGVGVRIGGTRIARVVSTTSTSLTFVAPAAVAGTYDVTLYRNGRTSVLVAGQVYGDAAPPVGGSQPGPSPAPGGAGPGAGTSPTPGPAPSPTPAPAPTPAPSPGRSTPAPGTPPGPGATPTQPRATRTGPGGERLVRNDALASLSGLWGMSCRTTCDGMQV